MRVVNLLSGIVFVLVALPSGALAWEAGDVEAAERFREAERERAEAFRRVVEEGRWRDDDRVATAPRERSREPERRRPRREARREPNALERAIEKEVERWRVRAGEWGEELAEEIRANLEEALREALDGGR